MTEQNPTRVAERASELSRTLDGIGPGLSGATRVSAMTAADLQRIIAGGRVAGRRGTTEESGGAGVDRSLETLVEDATGQVLRGAEATRGLGEGADQVWRRRILWVDDRPDRKTHERGVFESVGLEIETVPSTDEALAVLRRERFAAIISGMGRREGQREGYRLLELLRKDDKPIPYFICSGSRTPEHRREAAERGAQGATNTASELLEMVTSTLGSSRFP